jgi:hypothetical protein
VLLDNAVRAKSKLGNFKELAIGLEIFNLFNNQNAITNTFEMLIQNEYAIPNYMTTRVFNVKLSQVVKNHQQLLSDKHLFYCLK